MTNPYIRLLQLYENDKKKEYQELAHAMTEFLAIQCDFCFGRGHEYLTSSM